MTSAAEARVAKMRGEAVVADHPMLDSVAEMSKESRRLYGLVDRRATQMYKDMTGIDLKAVVFESKAGDLYELHPHVQLILVQRSQAGDVE